MRKHPNILLIVFIVLFSKLSFSQVLAKIDVNLSKAHIQIKPIEQEMYSNGSVFQGYSEGCCDLMDLFSSKKKIPPKDHYVFINGDPDNLSLIYLNLLCVDGTLQSVHQTSVGLHVQTMSSKLSGQLASGIPAFYVLQRNIPYIYRIVLSLYIAKYQKGFDENNSKEIFNFLNLVCSPEISYTFKINRIMDGNYRDDIFYTEYKSKIYHIRWDKNTWRDETERTYDRLMERYYKRLREKLSN